MESEERTVVPAELRDLHDLMREIVQSNKVPDFMRTIYSLYFPEVEEARNQLWASRPQWLYKCNFSGAQEIVGNHMVNVWRTWSEIGLGDAFPHQYAAAGASEVIQHLIIPGCAVMHCGLEFGLDVLPDQALPLRVAVLAGEYEGFGKIAEQRHILVQEYPSLQSMLDASDHGPSTVVFLSDPSAITGDYHDGLDQWLEAMRERHPTVRIVIDVTYVGLVKRGVNRNYAKHPNVRTILFSLSKPFGVYYDRIGGCVSRDPIPTLWANKWFCNVFSAAFGTLLMRRFPLNALAHKYATCQESVLRMAQDAGLVPKSAIPANVLLLATGPEGPDEFRRTDGRYRWCLTPGMYRAIERFGGKIEF